MCNLSDGVEQLGIEKGISIGIEQGMEQGGRKKLLELVEKKLQNKQSVEKIADDLCEEVEVIESIVRELEEKQ